MKIFQLRELFHRLMTRFSIFLLSYVVVMLFFNYELKPADDHNLLFYKLEDSSFEIYNSDNNESKNEFSDSSQLVSNYKVNNKFARDEILLSALVHAQSLQLTEKSFLYSCTKFINQCYRAFKDLNKTRKTFKLLS